MSRGQSYTCCRCGGTWTAKQDGTPRSYQQPAMTMDHKRELAEQKILTYLTGAAEPQTQQQIREAVVGDIRFIRAALTSLTRSGRVVRTGEGKRGKPCLYSPTDSGMEHTRQTRQLQTQNVPQVRVDIAEKLVCGNSHAITSFSKNGKNPEEETKLLALLEGYLPPFDLVVKLRMISDASPKKQRTSSFRKKFIAAMRERVASGAAPSEEAAATWLLGKALLYYEDVSQTWGKRDQRLCKAPAQFFEEKVYTQKRNLWKRAGRHGDEYSSGQERREQLLQAIRAARSSGDSDGSVSSFDPGFGRRMGLGRRMGFGQNVRGSLG